MNNELLDLDSEVGEPLYTLYQLKINRITKNDSDNTTDSINEIIEYFYKEGSFNKDFSISMLIGNVPDLNEPLLRESIAKKVEKGALSAKTGTIYEFDIGLKGGSISYLIIYRQPEKPSNEFIISLTLANSIHNLDLFRDELDIFVNEKIFPHLSSQNLDSKKIQAILKNWYDSSVLYMVRCSLVFKDYLAILFDQAFKCGSYELVNVDGYVADDIKLLFNSCSCSNLLALNKDETKDAKLRIEYESDSRLYSFSRDDASEYCKNLARKFCYSNKSVFQKKQVIEAIKLKIVQHLNVINRQLPKADENYHQLYLLYTYINSIKFKEIVFKLSENTISNANLFKVLNVVKEFLTENDAMEATELNITND